MTCTENWLVVDCARTTPFIPTEWEEKAGAAVRLREARTGVHSDMQPVLSHSCSTQSTANSSGGENSNNSFKCFTLRTKLELPCLEHQPLWMKLVPQFHKITESIKLKKTSGIIESNLWPITTLSTRKLTLSAMPSLS